MVTPQVQTAPSSHRAPVHSPHLSPYERVLAVGLGVALAFVAFLALMAPAATSGPVQTSDGSTVTAVQTIAHGKATARGLAAAPTAVDDSTSVE